MNRNESLRNKWVVAGETAADRDFGRIFIDQHGSARVAWDSGVRTMLWLDDGVGVYDTREEAMAACGVVPPRAGRP